MRRQLDACLLLFVFELMMLPLVLLLLFVLLLLEVVLDAAEKAFAFELS
jgi:hypothetical protein